MDDKLTWEEKGRKKREMERKSRQLKKEKRNEGKKGKGVAVR